ncbi:S-formylglutathione hydrolase [Paraphysoderma sedebokerense]|nr:S-formylglutathione hydrolase [Paraphysoderma sedebokerense]
MSFVKLLSSAFCFGGQVNKYEHVSTTVNCTMKFNVFFPKKALKKDGQKIPAIMFLSGLTCNEDNFITKSGAPQYAAKHGIALICPDTSPRGVTTPLDSESWDFGVAAAYYLDATNPAYSTYYNMYSYVTKEFYELVVDNFPIDPARISLMGHSVGGHGALTIALKNPNKFVAVSAFAPMSNPMNCPWGVKAFTRFLGEQKELWKEYDATELMKTRGLNASKSMDILVDQGSADKFLPDQLLTPRFVEAALAVGYHVTYKLRGGYDHSYFYVGTFVEEHIRWHAERL